MGAILLYLTLRDQNFLLTVANEGLIHRIKESKSWNSTKK